MAGARVPTRGRHALRRRALADDLVRCARVERGDLVLDLGAGRGIVTAALLAAGARVVAVELDDDLAAGLRRRLPDVLVVHGDATRIALPHEPFAVVSNLPFASGTALLRRLLDDPAVPVRRIDAIVEWGLAEKRARVWPSTQLSCYWGAWHELSVARRIHRTAFAPPPSVDAAVFRALRRRQPLVSPVPRPTSACCASASHRRCRCAAGSRAGSSIASRTSSASRPTPRPAISTRPSGLRSTRRSHPSAPAASLPLHEPFNPVQRGRKGVE